MAQNGVIREKLDSRDRFRDKRMRVRDTRDYAMASLEQWDSRLHCLFALDIDVRMLLTVGIDARHLAFLTVSWIFTRHLSRRNQCICLYLKMFCNIVHLCRKLCVKRHGYCSYRYFPYRVFKRFVRTYLLTLIWEENVSRKYKDMESLSLSLSLSEKRTQMLVYSRLNA